MEHVLEKRPLEKIPLIKRRIRTNRLTQNQLQQIWPLLLPVQDRPRWIPDNILDNWDTDPYAYQTEEDLMPAGGLHGELLGDIWEFISKKLRKRGMVMLMDTFVLYRDRDGIKDRDAPDLLVVPDLGMKLLPSSYDLEKLPTPICAFEITSPKSKAKDRANTKLYIEQWGVPTSVIIDRVDAKGNLLDEVKLSVWRRDEESGLAVQAQPDSGNNYYLKDLNMWIGVKEQSVYFIDGETLDVLLDVETERVTRQIAQKEVKAARKEAKAEAERAKAEAERAKAEAERAKAEAERARAAEKQAKEAEIRALSAEAEVAQLQSIRLQDKCDTLLLVLQQRFSDVSESMVAQIKQTDNIELLEQWLLRALTADQWQSIFEE